MLFSYVLLLNQIISSAKLVSGPKQRRVGPRRGSIPASMEDVSYHSWKGQHIINDLMVNYNRNVRPRPYGSNETEPPPVTVFTSLEVKSISTVKEQNMEFKAQFRFQQEWYDSRLRFNDGYFTEFEFIHLPNDPKQQVWLPDTFFQNEKDGKVHMIDQENYSIKIRFDGKVLYNRRLSMTFSCVMDLLRYPMDVQKCFIDFASYAYTTDDIVYEWDSVPFSFLEGATSSLPNFIITKYYNDSCTSITNTGTYSCLRIVLHLRRVLSFFLLQLYIPSSMLVAVSWVSYWIDWRATAGRVPLAIVTLLTMITQSHVINANLPPVSYTKAIDVWIGACVMFIFGSLVEYAFVNYTGIQEQRRKGGTSSTGGTYDTGNNCGQSFWYKLFGSARLAQQRQLENEHFVRNNASSSSPEPQEMALLRRRSRGRLRRQTLEEQTEMLSDYQTAAVAASRQLLGRPEALSNMAVQFEDISENVDWIRLRTRRRVELFRWCNIFKQRSRAERIDVVSRAIFPVAFVLFNIVYWWVYW